MVCVGPPLSASGPSKGLSGEAMVPVRSEPTQPELPSVSPIRLLPREVKSPRDVRARGGRVASDDRVAQACLP